MAEGGYDESDPLITHDDEDDDEEDDKYDKLLKGMKDSREYWEKKVEENKQKQKQKLKAQQALSETQPFLPGHSSTPYHGGEQVEMQTTMHEQTGAPPSYAETSFGGGPTIDKISSEFEKLKKNETTGILDISKEVPVINVEDFLDSELKNEQIERARRFIRSRYPQFIEKI